MAVVRFLAAPDELLVVTGVWWTFFVATALFVTWVLATKVLYSLAVTSG